MRQEPEQSNPSAGGACDEPRAPGDVTVLVVDDEPDVVNYFSSVLEDAGLNVLCAYDGDKAMEMLGTHRIDLISLDLVMPRKSGIRLFMELRRTPEWSRIPVVFVTGHARDPEVKKDVASIMANGSMVGPSLCLEKPVTPDSYLGHICKILGVEWSGSEEESDRAEELRDRARSLLESADARTLEAMLEQMKRGRD